MKELRRFVVMALALGVVLSVSASVAAAPDLALSEANVLNAEWRASLGWSDEAILATGVSAAEIAAAKKRLAWNEFEASNDVAARLAEVLPEGKQAGTWLNIDGSVTVAHIGAAPAKPDFGEFEVRFERRSETLAAALEKVPAGKAYNVVEGKVVSGNEVEFHELSDGHNQLNFLPGQRIGVQCRRSADGWDAVGDVHDGQIGFFVSYSNASGRSYGWLTNAHVLDNGYCNSSTFYDDANRGPIEKFTSNANHKAYVAAVNGKKYQPQYWGPVSTYLGLPVGTTGAEKLTYRGLFDQGWEDAAVITMKSTQTNRANKTRVHLTENDNGGQIPGLGASDVHDYDLYGVWQTNLSSYGYTLCVPTGVWVQVNGAVSSDDDPTTICGSVTGINGQRVLVDFPDDPTDRVPTNGSSGAPVLKPFTTVQWHDPYAYGLYTGKLSGGAAENHFIYVLADHTVSATSVTGQLDQLREHFANAFDYNSSGAIDVCARNSSGYSYVCPGG